MDETTALAVLNRFDEVIRNVARKVAESFPGQAEVEDAEQDARILILSYAGLVPGGRLPDELAKVESMTNGDEDRIRKLVSTQLRLDLNQQYGREADKREPTVSIDHIGENHMPSTFDIQDALKAEEAFRVKYPTLAAWIVDDMTQDQIAQESGVQLRTVERKIAREKRAYLIHYVTRGGLKVEGDETLDELQEACGYLKEAGR